LRKIEKNRLVLEALPPDPHGFILKEAKNYSKKYAFFKAFFVFASVKMGPHYT